MCVNAHVDFQMQNEWVFGYPIVNQCTNFEYATQFQTLARDQNSLLDRAFVTTSINALGDLR